MTLISKVTTNHDSDKAVISDTSENSTIVNQASKIQFNSTFGTWKVNVHRRHTVRSIPEWNCWGYTTQWWHRSYGAPCYPRNPSKPRKVKTDERRNCQRWSTTGAENTDSRRFPNTQKGLKTHSHTTLEYQKRAKWSRWSSFQRKTANYSKNHAEQHSWSNTWKSSWNRKVQSMCESKLLCTGLECHVTSMTRLRSVPSAWHTDTIIRRNRWFPTPYQIAHGKSSDLMYFKSTKENRT